MSTLTVGTISEKVTDAGVAVDGVTLKDGGATFTSAVGVTGNTTITSGNLVIGTSGNGIDFSATSDGTTMSSELLDDYEEGSYVVTLASESGTVTINTSFDTASYTKIGRLVHCCALINVSSVSSATGWISVSLPFTPANLSERIADSSASVVVNNVSSGNIADFIASINENDARIFIQMGDATSTQNLSANKLQAGTNITFSATYITA